VPKIAKRFLFVAAVGAGLFAIVLLCVNLYLQSGGVQQRIRAAAERSLGSEVRIGSTSYTPWGGLSLRELSVPDPTQPQRNIVEARGLRLRFPLLPLLSQRFVVRDCVLIEPTLLVRQDAEGNWLLPLPGRKPKAPEVAPETGAPRIKGPAFRTEVEKLRLAEGAIAFIDAKGRRVLTLDKADINAVLQPDGTAEGTFYVARVDLSGSLKPKKIGGPFRWDGKVLDLPAIKGVLAGGDLQATFRLDAGKDPAFTLTSSLSGVLLRKLAEDADVEPGRTDGQLQGTLELAGDPRTTDSLQGKGHFELVAAKLRPMEILVKFGELFQIDELQLLQLHDARVDLVIADERVQLNDLVMKSENLILTGSGPIRFNGKLNLDARLLVNEKLQRSLKSVLGDKLEDSGVEGYRQIPFSVTGKVDNPKTDLLDKIVGVKISGEVPGLLKNLFQALPKSGGEKKKNDKK
jgi:uncharacterized protein involved in outer membrane biogenesis